MPESVGAMTADSMTVPLPLMEAEKKAAKEIDYTKKLPDAEFEVMQAVW